MSDTPVPAEESWYKDEDAVKALNEFFFGRDAREERQIIIARIENHQNLARSTGGLIKNYHLNEINKLQARLKALEERSAEAQYAADTLAVTRTSVAIASVLGIALVGMAALYVGANTWKTLKSV